MKSPLEKPSGRQRCNLDGDSKISGVIHQPGNQFEAAGAHPADIFRHPVRQNQIDRRIGLAVFGGSIPGNPGTGAAKLRKGDKTLDGQLLIGLMNRVPADLNASERQRSETIRVPAAPR